jgi:hypothetical protein
MARDIFRFERSKPGRYSILKDGVHVAETMRYSTKWIAWYVPSNQAVRGPWGLGGSPFNRLSDVRAHFAAYGIQGGK